MLTGRAEMDSNISDVKSKSTSSVHGGPSDQQLLKLLSVLQHTMSAASSDTFVDECASVESTLAGVDVDTVSGPAVLHLLMSVLVLNQH